jgi:flavodoxin
MKRTLIVYFSMGGHTRMLAEELRAATGADIEEITEVHPRSGLRGMWRAVWDASWRRRTPIRPIRRDPAAYDLVVLGGPIWARRLAAPVRTFAQRYCPQAQAVAFFCTEGGSGADSAFDDLRRLSGQRPVVTLAVDGKHLDPTEHRSDLGRFIANLMRAPDGGHPGAGLPEAIGAH